MEMTKELMNELMDEAFDIPIMSPKHRSCLCFTKNIWKILRDRSCCESFTDEELNLGKNPFKRGWVIGAGVVDMLYADLYYENADNVATMDRVNTIRPLAEIIARIMRSSSHLKRLSLIELKGTPIGEEL